MAYVLILWVETRQTSVIPIKNLKTKGEIVTAKWGDSWYPAKVLQRSENQKWLESLSVTTDGIILEPDDDDLDSSLLLEKRKEIKIKNKNIKAIQNKNKINEAERIQNTNSIFDKELNIKNNKVDEDVFDNFIENDNIIQPHNSNEIVQNIVEKTKCSCCICKKIKLSVEDIDNIINILSIIKNLHFKDNCSNLINNKDTIKDENSDRTVRSFINVQEQKIDTNLNEDNKKFVPLIQNSSVLIQQWKINIFKESYRKKPKEMVRRLMIEILGKETLKKSSPTGRNNRQPIPKNVYDDVEIFVRENTKRNYRLTNSEYRQCLTSLCATLRNPKTKEDTKNINKMKNMGLINKLERTDEITEDQRKLKNETIEEVHNEGDSENENENRKQQSLIDENNKEKRKLDLEFLNKMREFFANEEAESKKRKLN